MFEEHADIETVRPCPYCNAEVLLAACPIVATTERWSEYHRRFASHPDWPGEVLESLHSGRDRTIIARPPDLSDERKEYEASVASYRSASKMGRMVGRVDRPTGPPRLPTPVELASTLGGQAGRPRRACPQCGEPFPEGFAERESFVFSVIGPMGTAKSTFLGRLYELTWRNQGDQFERQAALQAAGLEHLRPINGETRVMKELAADVSAGNYPARTDAAGLENAYAPSVFNVATTDREGLLFLFDVSGEDVEDPSNMALFCPFVAWSDGIIFMVDPGRLDKRYAERTGTAHDVNTMVDEGELISGILDQLRLANNNDCPISIVITCADVLADDPSSFAQLRSVVGTSDERQVVMDLLTGIGGGHIIQALSQRERENQVSYHLMAALPHPHAPSREPVGVLEVLASVVGRSRLMVNG